MVGQAFLPVSDSAAFFRISGRLGNGKNAVPLADPTTDKNVYPTGKTGEHARPTQQEYQSQWDLLSRLPANQAEKAVAEQAVEQDVGAVGAALGFHRGIRVGAESAEAEEVGGFGWQRQGGLFGAD